MADDTFGKKNTTRGGSGKRRKKSTETFEYISINMYRKSTLGRPALENLNAAASALPALKIDNGCRRGSTIAVWFATHDYLLMLLLILSKPLFKS